MSEYIEGSSFNKAIEIYNGTVVLSISLPVLHIRVYSNGISTVSQSMHYWHHCSGDVYVLAHRSADPAFWLKLMQQIAV